MSAICHGFVQNAWRKDICSNCFRLRDEHLAKSDSNRFGHHHQQQQYHQLQQHQQHQQRLENGGRFLKDSSEEDISESRNKMMNAQQNHSISILVKNSDGNLKNSSGGTGRYQSPNSGIPRASSHLKYQHSLSGKPYFNSSTFSADSLKGKQQPTNIHNGLLTNGSDSRGNSAEVIDISSSTGSKKVLSHPFRSGDKLESHVQITSSGTSNNAHNRLVNSSNGILNGSTPPAAPSSSSTVVLSVNGGCCSGEKSSSGTPSPTSPHHFNNNKHSANANNNSNTTTTTTNSNHSPHNRRKNNSVSSTSGSAGASAPSSVNGTVLSVVGISSSSSSSNTSSNRDGKNHQQILQKQQSVPSSIGSSSSSSGGGSSSGGAGGCGNRRKKSVNGSAVGESVVVNTEPLGKRMEKSYSMDDAMDGDAGLRRTKGILKAVNGKNVRKLSVKFPKEVVEVIGYSGDSEASEDEDEDEDMSDPQDLSSIAELLANNSTSAEEKELHQQTIKNTNFNSIKSNLMGFAPIEIGPIVGCTGGKSMENSTKPLVSIGTFEARKEPLRITRKSDADGEVDVIPVESAAAPTTTNNQRKAAAAAAAKVSKDTAAAIGALFKNAMSTSSSGGRNGQAENTNNNSSNNSNNNNNNKKSSQQSRPVNNANEVLSGASLKVPATTTATTTTTTSTPTSLANGKHDVRINGKDVVSGHDGVSTIEVNPEKFPITLTTEIPCQSGEDGSAANQMTTTSKAGDGGRCKPKPILKTSSLPNGTSGGSGSGSNSPSEYNGSDKPSSPSSNNNMINGRSTVEKSLSNLIILNSGSIASKRTSFLQEIISAEPVTILTGQTSTTTTTTTTSNNINNSSGSSSGNSTCSENYYPQEEPMSLNLERDSLEASMHNLKLGPFKTYEIEDNSSEFDDSLEDSGLDIAKAKLPAENSSESEDNDNEKFGSSSDSGNENDFTDSRMDLPKGGLYISVEDAKGDETKPKLSPDSVLFSSASETSNPGSAESIPECVNVHVVSSPSSAVVKRQAPPPPLLPPPSDAESLYANQSCADEAEVYDDVVSTYGKRQPNMSEADRMRMIMIMSAEQEEEQESIYDDCHAVSSSGKSVTGSYDFTNGMRTKLDTDSGPDSTQERIPRHVDGIEFIGIRKIDSETHLNNAGLSNSSGGGSSSSGKQGRSPSPEDSKRERSSSVSPKARRKVNHFFSTIGKKAGAAFGGGHSPLSGAAGFMRHKSPSPGPSVATVSEYKRSLSQDEVSMTRTQEIYATLTPASLKFKGLAPVLQKLSRMDTVDGKDESPKEKMFKKHKILPSIKKLLRMGSKDTYDGMDGRSYDFKTDSSRAGNTGGDSFPGSTESSSSSNPSSLEEEEDERNRRNNSDASPAGTPPVTPSNCNSSSSSSSSSNAMSNQAPPKPAAPHGRPPPPPPRVHSLDLMQRVGHQVAMHGPNGTVKPARPPPPVRSNRIAPSFVSVFAAPEEDPVRDPGPPSKPKRKASMNAHSTAAVARSDGGEPSLDNHVSNLNMETLKLIAGQAPGKITCNSSQLMANSSSSSSNSGTRIRWSQFYLSNVEPMADGDGFAFYAALWQDQPCTVLLEEGSNDSVVISCIDACTAFVDIVPAELVPWNAAEYSNGGLDVRVSISVLPPCTVTQISSYMSSHGYPSLQKYYVLLQSLQYWGKADMADLFVFQQGSWRGEVAGMGSESELVYVVPVRSERSSRVQPSATAFEILMKELLLQPYVTTLGDQEVLLRLISGSLAEVEAQVKLFLQVKLFGHRMKPDELDKMRRTRSERAVLQWLERERALCMKEAIERTLFRDSEPISPMRKSFIEFLMIPDTSAKALLELVLDLSSSY